VGWVVQYAKCVFLKVTIGTMTSVSAPEDFGSGKKDITVERIMV